MKTEFNPKEYGATGDGVTLDTAAIQKAMDMAAAVGNEETPARVRLSSGTYLTSSLFLGSHTTFHMEEGAVLLGTTEEAAYPLMKTRVAGIEMEWPVGILNINGQRNVTVTGNGRIDGQGPYWWNKYWGDDKKGGMRKDYDARGLRWCVDYDCKRVRNVVVMESQDVELSGFESVRSGFWNVHLCYSRGLHVHHLFIHDNDGPSTDGIDIDSCENVLVEQCKVACNDDSICVKSGRDWDGLRVNRICQDVTIQNCEILTGCGVTIGSETSGGAKNITVRNLKYHGTDCGFRMKSARTRGGLMEDILVENLEMVNVKYPLNLCLNWHPAYSYCELPSDYQGDIPPHWHTLTTPVPEAVGIPQVQNLTIRNVTSKIEPGYDGISRAFEIDAFTEKPMKNVTLQNIRMEAKEFGRISGIMDWKWDDVVITATGKPNPDNDQYDIR